MRLRLNIRIDQIVIAVTSGPPRPGYQEIVETNHGPNPNLEDPAMTNFAKTLTVATLAIVLSVATLAATSSADARPRGEGTRTVSGMDLGSGR